MLAGGTEFSYDELIAVGLTCAASVGIGLFVRSRRERVEVYRERAERLERERELLAERAVAEERVRIARSCTTSSRTTSA
jgi:ribosomal protein L13E